MQTKPNTVVQHVQAPTTAFPILWRSTTLLDAQILDPPDQSITYDAEYLTDGTTSPPPLRAVVPTQSISIETPVTNSFTELYTGMCEMQPNREPIYKVDRQIRTRKGEGIKYYSSVAARNHAGQISCRYFCLILREIQDTSDLKHLSLVSTLLHKYTLLELYRSITFFAPDERNLLGRDSSPSHSKPAL